ncbi:hypothetical protein IIA79_03720 [bacterium]|nr:hypothetical protein [bacterium]
MSAEGLSGYARTGSFEVIQDRLAVAYHSQSSLDLEYQRALDAEGTEWGTPVLVDFEGDVGAYASLVQAGGLQAIAYLDNSEKALRFVRAADEAGTEWSEPRVLDQSVGELTMKLLEDGRPAIIYYKLNTTDLMFLAANNREGTSWGIPGVIDPGIEDSGIEGHMPDQSFALVSGNPAVCYLYREYPQTKLEYYLRFAMYY